MGCRHLHTGNGEPYLSVTGEHQAHTGCRAVDSGNERFTQAEVIGKGGIELVLDPVARFRQFVRGAGIVG